MDIVGHDRGSSSNSFGFHCLGSKVGNLTRPTPLNAGANGKVYHLLCGFRYSAVVHGYHSSFVEADLYTTGSTDAHSTGSTVHRCTFATAENSVPYINELSTPLFPPSRQSCTLPVVLVLGPSENDSGFREPGRPSAPLARASYTRDYRLKSSATANNMASQG